MNLKYYLRGLGLGIVLTAIMLAFVSESGKGAMDDEEVILKAKALGMIEESELPEYVEEARERAESGLRAEIEEELRAEIRAEVEAEMSGQTVTGALNGDGTDKAADQNAKEADADSMAVASAEGGALDGAGTSTGSGVPLNVGVSVGEGGETGEHGEAASEGTSGTGEGGTAGTVKGSETANGNGTADGSEETGNADETGGSDAVRTAGAPESTGQEPERVEFIVNKGEMAREISRGLEKAGLVESASDFESFLLSNGYDRFIKASRYLIPVGADEEQIANIITNYGAE